jgi:hypothetical protein
MEQSSRGKDPQLASGLHFAIGQACQTMDHVDYWLAGFQTYCVIWARRLPFDRADLRPIRLLVFELSFSFPPRADMHRDQMAGAAWHRET